MMSPIRCYCAESTYIVPPLPGMIECIYGNDDVETVR